MLSLIEFQIAILHHFLGEVKLVTVSSYIRWLKGRNKGSVLYFCQHFENAMVNWANS